MANMKRQKWLEFILTYKLNDEKGNFLSILILVKLPLKVYINGTIFWA